MRYSVAKVIVSLLVVVWYFLMPQFGFTGAWDLRPHLLYPLCHANVWHLLANVLCLWMIPSESHLLTAFVCSVLCSYLPCFVTEPTMGLSGVLFAIVGISWGKVRRFRDMFWKNRWFLIIPVFIPHVNAFIHVYCLVAGYVAGRYLPLKNSEWI